LPTQQSMVNSGPSSNRAESTNLPGGEYGQLLHLAELQRIGDIGNAAVQFQAPQNSSYGNIHSAATSYGTPFDHIHNLAPAQRVLFGHVGSVAPAFGVAQPWRSAHFVNAAPTYEETRLHGGETLEHNMIPLQANFSDGFIRRQK
ncbi:hypothetical protein MKW94_025222, partial [Papaver nudicaule]|nr:hypothetical protein [Papaver nudicaule]